MKQWISSKNVVIYYEEFGEGRPVFNFHGGTLDHHHLVWELEGHYTERKGWRRIYPDIIGEGMTPGVSWITHRDQVLEVLLEFMEALAPGERYVVGGHSYGGYLTLGVIYKMADRLDGVYLNAPWYYVNREERDLPQHEITRQEQAFLDALTPDEQEYKDFLINQTLETLIAFRNIEPVSKGDKPAQGTLSRKHYFSFESELIDMSFHAPALIITGRQDFGCGYQDAFKFVRKFTRATYAVLDSAGHGVAYEQRALHQALFSEFLDRVEYYSQHHSGVSS